MIYPALSAIIQCDIKTSRDCDNQLLKESMRMTSAARSARDIIQIVHSGDIKWDVIPPFGKGEIPTWISDYRQVDEVAEI